MSQKIAKITAAMKQIKIKERLLKYEAVEKKFKNNEHHSTYLLVPFHDSCTDISH